MPFLIFRSSFSVCFSEPPQISLDLSVSVAFAFVEFTYLLFFSFVRNSSVGMSKFENLQHCIDILSGIILEKIDLDFVTKSTTKGEANSFNTTCMRNALIRKKRSSVSLAKLLLCRVLYYKRQHALAFTRPVSCVSACTVKNGSRHASNPVYNIEVGSCATKRDDKDDEEEVDVDDNDDDNCETDSYSLREVRVDHLRFHVYFSPFQGRETLLRPSGETSSFLPSSS